MSDTRIDKVNSILYKIAKPIVLATCLLWIPIKLYETQFTFLSNYFLLFALVGNVIFGTFFVSIIASKALSKEKAKEKIIRAIIIVLGLLWGLHSYTLFTKHKFMSVTAASIMSWIAFSVGIVAVLLLTGFSLYYFAIKRNGN